MKNIPKDKFCYTDTHCRLKFKWEVSGISGSYFNSSDKLKSISEDDKEICAASEMIIYLLNLCFSFIISL